MIARLRSLFAPRKPALTWANCVADLTAKEQAAIRRKDMKAVGKARSEKTKRLRTALAGAVKS